MRVLLRALPLVLLWSFGLFPAALVLIDRATPLGAVHVQLAVASALRSLAIFGGGAALVLALLVPPFSAGLRLLLHTAVDRLRADRGPLLRAQGELRHLESAARHLEAGRAALAIRDARTALPHLARAIELEPQTIAAHYQVGLALMALGRPDRAIAPLHHTVGMEPGHAFGDALLMLGRCHMLAKDHRTAAELLARHAREHGGNRRSHFWLGQSLAAAGDHGAARTAFAAAAAPPPARPRLTASESFYRARARVALWRMGAPR